MKVAEPIGNDATGYDVLTAAMKSLLNQFPGLYPDEAIKFEELGAEVSGMPVSLLCSIPFDHGSKGTTENYYSGIPGYAGSLALPRTLRD